MNDLKEIFIDNSCLGRRRKKLKIRTSKDTIYDINNNKEVIQELRAEVGFMLLIAMELTMSILQVRSALAEDGFSGHLMENASFLMLANKLKSTERNRAGVRFM